MNWLRLVKKLLLVSAILVLLVLLGVASIWWYLHPRLERNVGVVYGRSQNQDLTLDVLRPTKPNRLGIVLMASGGWKSRAGTFQPWIVAPLLRRGYTVFAVYHIPQPEASVMEITDQVNRAVRYIRHHAAEFQIDPQRLGVAGGSSGGHLSLMLATRGGPGPSNAADPVDAQSSAVQAVTVFFPVTDLLNLGSSTENPGNGGPPRSFVRAFGPDSTNLTVWKGIGRDLSPICHVRSNLPPILIHHGDADTLVPLDQSQRFQTEARRLGCTVEVIVHRGGKHGWWTMLWDIRQFAGWFDRHLRPSHGAQTQ